MTDKYDALGRRVEKDLGSNNKERYIYSGAETIATYNAFDTWKQDFVYAQGIDRIVMLEQADVLDHDSDQNTTEVTRSYYHRSALGSVMEITDANEATALSYRYDPYGTVTITRNQQTQSTDPLRQHWTCTGRFLDEESNLYHYRTRVYDPVLGRFLQRDPLGLGAGPNRYSYVSSRPQCLVDPFGLWESVPYEPGLPDNYADEYIKALKDAGVSPAAWPSDDVLALDVANKRVGEGEYRETITDSLFSDARVERTTIDCKPRTKAGVEQRREFRAKFIGAAKDGAKVVKRHAEQIGQAFRPRWSPWAIEVKDPQSVELESGGYRCPGEVTCLEKYEDNGRATVSNTRNPTAGATGPASCCQHAAYQVRTGGSSVPSSQVEVDIQARISNRTCVRLPHGPATSPREAVDPQSQAHVPQHAASDGGDLRLPALFIRA